MRHAFDGGFSAASLSSRPEDEPPLSPALLIRRTQCRVSAGQGCVALNRGRIRSCCPGALEQRSPLESQVRELG